MNKRGQFDEGINLWGIIGAVVMAFLLFIMVKSIALISLPLKIIGIVVGALIGYVLGSKIMDSD